MNKEPTVRDDMKKDLLDICTHFGDDLNYKRLLRQLDVLRDVCKDKCIKTVRDVCKYINNEVFGEVSQLIRLFLVIPVTSATAERSFSAMRRLKTYLRSTMTAERLNSVTVLNVHKDMLDSVDNREILNEFVARNDTRTDIFGSSCTQADKHTLKLA